MGKGAKEPTALAAEFAADCRAAFAADLVGVVLYGSAAAGDYVPGRSDINFLVVVTEAGMQDLRRAFPLVKKWRPKGVTTPLFLIDGQITADLRYQTLTLQHQGKPIAYVLMPNHLHLPVRKPHTNLREIVRHFRIAYAIRLK